MIMLIHSFALAKIVCKGPFLHKVHLCIFLELRNSHSPLMAPPLLQAVAAVVVVVVVEVVVEEEELQQQLWQTGFL